MKIAFFLNTLKSDNWGSLATSNALRKMVEKCCDEPEFTPVDFSPLPTITGKVLKSYCNNRLMQSVLKDDEAGIARWLEILGVDMGALSGFDKVCFNGEGAVHCRSGHIVRLLSSVYYMKKQGAYVSALNQTVDIPVDAGLLVRFVKKVFSSIDYVAVREPVSKRLLASIDIHAELVPDAVFSMERMSEDELDERVRGCGVSGAYVCVTGSSSLRKNRASVYAMGKLLDAVSQSYGGKIIFLANTKTDRYLANKLSVKYKFKIVSNNCSYLDAIAVIARSDGLLGGRQHPALFAAIYGVPICVFEGNTHKMSGILELLGIGRPVVRWFSSEREIESRVSAFMENMESGIAKYVPNLECVHLGPGCKS